MFIGKIEDNIITVKSIDSLRPIFLICLYDYDQSKGLEKHRIDAACKRFGW